MAPDIQGVIDSINLRLESLEKKVQELQSGQTTIMKLLEKIYQAQLTTLSHQKLTVAITPLTDIPAMIVNGINIIDGEPPIEPTALLCSTIRKLYTHEEIKQGVIYDDRMNKIKELIQKTYFKDDSIQFNVFWKCQAKKTISGQRRSLCSRDKKKRIGTINATTQQHL